MIIKLLILFVILICLSIYAMYKIAKSLREIPLDGAQYKEDFGEYMRGYDEN